MEGILGTLRPRLAIEIGTAEGAALQRIAAHAGEVHAFDLFPPSLPVGDNVVLHTGNSHELLPAFLRELAEAGRSADFALVDGDTRPAGWTLRELYPKGGPDLVEFGDYLGELHARRRRPRRGGGPTRGARGAAWPYAALEALHLNRPVLATPTGRFVEMIRSGAGGLVDARDARRGRGGWPAPGARGARDRAGACARGRAAAAGRRADRRRRDRARLRIAAGRAATTPTARAGRRLRHRQPEELDGRGARGAPSALVYAVVPYFRAHRFVRHDRLPARPDAPADGDPRRNDGSWTDDDEVLAELSARLPVTVLHEPNAGLGAARNFGIRQCRARYVLPLDSDNMVEPEFVAHGWRCSRRARTSIT